MKSFPFYIPSERTVLIPCDETLIEKIIAGDKGLGEYLETEVAIQWAEFGVAPYEYTLRKIKGKPDDVKWWSYLVIHRRDNKLIGGGGFKGPPDSRGMVEIGYGIAPEYRDNGLATEVADALVEHARRFKNITIIQAHTLAEKNASNTILKKLGMVFMEEILDPEDGAIWRFARGRR